MTADMFKGANAMRIDFLQHFFGRPGSILAACAGRCRGGRNGLQIAAIIILATIAQPYAAARANPKPLVFAHYMVCCTMGGNDASVDQLAAEIALAKRYEIDGFALNVGGWSREPLYPRVVARFFEAARRTGGFKLFISVDNCCGMTEEEVADMLQKFGSDPNYFHVDGKPLISTFLANPDWTRLHTVLTAAGLKMTYVPHEFPDTSPETPPADAISRMFARNPRPDGYFYFGAAGTGAQIASSSGSYAKTALATKLIYMASVTPYYFGYGRNNRVYDNGGFSAMEAEWRAAIAGHATWIEIVTWNDWGESTYVRPFVNANFRPAGVSTPPLLAHDGFLDASLPYIRWFHTGRLPPVTVDRVHVFYRPNPAANCDPSPGSTDHPCPGGWKNLSDRLYLVIEARRDTRLTVSNGSNNTVLDVPAGRSTRAISLVAGPISVSAESEGTERHLNLPLPFGADNRELREAMFAGSF